MTAAEMSSYAVTSELAVPEEGAPALETAFPDRPRMVEGLRFAQ